MLLSHHVLIISQDNNTRADLIEAFNAGEIPFRFWPFHQLSLLSWSLNQYVNKGLAPPAAIVIEINNQFAESQAFVSLLHSHRLTGSIPIIAYGPALPPALLEKLYLTGVLMHLAQPFNSVRVVELIRKADDLADPTLKGYRVSGDKLIYVAPENPPTAIKNN